MTDEKSNKALLDRYELLKGAEQHKNALIEVSRAFDSNSGPPSRSSHGEKQFHIEDSQGIMKFLVSSIPTLLTSGVTFRSFCTGLIQSLYSIRGNTLT